MTTKFNNKINLFFFTEFLLCSIIILATLLQKTSIVSNAFMASFLLLIVYAIGIMIVYNANNYLFLILLITVLSLINVLISSIINNATIDINYLSEYFLFLSTIFFLFVVFNTNINLKTAKAVLIFNVFISYLYPIAYKYFPQNNKFSDLALNFSNPNLTGMWILQSILYATLAVIIIKSWIIKIAAAVSVPINIGLINLTAARNCIIAFTLFIALCIWIVLKKRKCFSKSLILFINVIPIVFVPLYLSLINIIQQKGWLNFLIKEGKPLTSRTTIWQSKFEQIKNLWITGNYAISKGNSHNSQMVILSSYGIIVLILVIYLFYKFCMETNNNSKSKKNLFALSAFFSVIFMGLGEGALFSGGMGIFVMACGFLIIARCDFCDNNDKGNEVKQID